MSASTDPHEALIEALIKARSEFTVVNKAHTAKLKTKVGDYSYTYADLADIMAMVEPILHKNGLLVAHSCHDMQLTTSVYHKLGASLQTTLPIKQSTTPQGLGSEITYMRRYGLTMLLAIVTDDDDGAVAQDEATNQNRAGAAASAPARKPKAPAQPGTNSKARQALWAAAGKAAKALGETKDGYLRAQMPEGVESTQDLSDEQTAEMIKRFNKVAEANTPPEEE